MAGLNLNVGLSVFKRETQSLDAVQRSLENNGWSRVGSYGGRARVFEKSGISITAVKGPLATIVMPSGPLRGKIFSEDAVGINRLSVIGTSQSSEDNANRKERERQKNEMEVRDKADSLT